MHLSPPARPRFLVSSARQRSLRRAHSVSCFRDRWRAQCQASDSGTDLDRRTATLGVATLAALTAVAPQRVEALPGFQKDLKRARRVEVPEADYKEGPQGLKYYDVSIGNGPIAKQGLRVAVHYDARWRGVTFMTSRQGMGVTGGEPLGFDVGAQGAGGTLKGLDLGVRGMKQGGQRKLIVPPELAYGSKGVAEIPPNATLNIDVQLLSVKTDAIGFRTKVVEG